MNLINLVLSVIAVVYILQCFLVFVYYYVVKKKLADLTIAYRNNFAFFMFIALLLLFVLLILIRVLFLNYLGFILILPSFFSYTFLKMFFDNTILISDNFIYNGSGVIAKNQIKCFREEEGFNLEKKYGHKSNFSLIKHNYFVIELKSGKTIASKVYFSDYLKTMYSVLK